MNLLGKPKKKGFKHLSAVHICVFQRGACIRRWQRIFPSPLFPAFPPLQKWGGGGKGRGWGGGKRAFYHHLFLCKACKIVCSMVIYSPLSGNAIFPTFQIALFKSPNGNFFGALPFGKVKKEKSYAFLD